MTAFAIQYALEDAYPPGGIFLHQSTSDIGPPAPLAWPSGLNMGISTNISWFILSVLSEQANLLLATEPLLRLDDLYQKGKGGGGEPGGGSQSIGGS